MAEDQSMPAAASAVQTKEPTKAELRAAEQAREQAEAERLALVSQSELYNYAMAHAGYQAPAEQGE